MATLKSNVSASLGLLPLKVNIKTIVEEDRAVSLSNACVGTSEVQHPPVRIRQDNRCPECSNNDKESHIKVRVVGKNDLVPVPQEELDKVAEEGKKFSERMPLTIHPAADVEASTIETGKAYYLEPADVDFAEIYALVAHEITKHPEKAVVTMWAARSAPAMYRWTVKDNVIIIRQLAWPHQVQARPAVPTEFNDASVPMAEMAMNSLAADFDPDTYKDSRGDILAAFVDTQTPVGASVTELPKTASGAIDIMGLLARSIEQAEGEKKPAKKAAAKPRKTTVRKSA